MLIILYVIPFLTVVSALLVYRLNGKKEFLKLDLVQFFYAFVLSPILFVWVKSFLYYLMQSEVEVQLTQNQMFFYDTVFSVFFLFIFGFVVIHSLTKSFNLKLHEDPLHDLFHHSEYFHLWLTHLMVFGGVLSFFTAMALFNIWVPFEAVLSKAQFYSLLVFGGATGLLAFLGIWMSDPKQQSANFMRLMKLLFGVLFIVHVLAYFFTYPDFSGKYGMYWWSFTAFTSLVVCSLFAYKSEKAQTLFEWISDKLRHHKNEINIQLFDSKRH